MTYFLLFIFLMTLFFLLFLLSFKKLKKYYKNYTNLFSRFFFSNKLVYKNLVNITAKGRNLLYFNIVVFVFYNIFFLFALNKIVLNFPFYTGKEQLIIALLNCFYVVFLIIANTLLIEINMLYPKKMLKTAWLISFFNTISKLWLILGLLASFLFVFTSIGG